MTPEDRAEYASTRLEAAKIALINAEGALSTVRSDLAMMRNAISLARATNAALEAELNDVRADLEADRSLVRGGGA
jgi:hypothetical protein